MKSRWRRTAASNAAKKWADPNAYATALDISTLGEKPADDLTGDEQLLTAETNVVCQYDGANSDAAAGRADVIVEFAIDNDL